MHKPVEARQKRPADGRFRTGPLQHSKSYSLGFDIGSASSDVVLLDNDGKVIFSDYRRTMGRGARTLYSQLTELFDKFRPSEITTAAATGSAARLLTQSINIPFINEVLAQATAINRLYPDFSKATIIEMGGQDSKLIFTSTEKGRMRVDDFALNTVCAAGTGSFLDQQAQRLGVNIENEFGQLALQSKNVPRMAGRCSVFAKSDMIHLQQQATPNCDIIAGLCLAFARNLKSDLGSGRQFAKPIIFTGGVAANIGVVRALENVLGLRPDELIVPKQHFFTGAIGAVLIAQSRQQSTVYNYNSLLEKLRDFLTMRRNSLSKAPRRKALTAPSSPPPESIVHEELLHNAAGPLTAYLGVDVGSISTNVAVIDEQKRLLAKAYLMTAGKPLEAVRKGLDIIGGKVEGKVKIAAAATTGSGRYLTGDFIGADVVINEITAQAAGAAIVKPAVDTIFEIGGQDSKFISLENGVVVDFEMNHACAAGTGSFLEEQAQRLGINIDGEFAELAFSSDSPIKLGERCTVFMESDLLSYQQQGARIPELVAGLSYSIVANYLNRVVGRRRIGNNICFQGGTAFNRAVWSAFEKVLDRPVSVPDHHEVTGAIGAAAIAAEHMQAKAQKLGRNIDSGFRGFKNLVAVQYTVESFTCEHCPNHCEIKKVQLPRSEPLYYGSRCDRYNLKKKTAMALTFDAFEFRNKMLFEFAGLNQKPLQKPKFRIAMPLALINWQLLPLFSRFFKALGCEPIVSRPTSKKTIRAGTEAVAAQPCFPVKVAYGHVAELLEKNVDYIFIPSIVSMPVCFAENKHNQLCPYVQSFAYQARTAFSNRLPPERILTEPLRLGEGRKQLLKGFLRLGRRLGAGGGVIRKAVAEALDAQAGFEGALKQKGSEILSSLKPDEKLFVLISRPYNGCDEGVNLQLPKKLADLNAKIIPMDMLDLSRAVPANRELHTSVYWSYGQKILRAAEMIKDSPNLFAIYLSNFSCGPDSFLQSFFKDIMDKKPSLLLELDEHSADAGVITRLEAFFESLKNYRAKPVKQTPAESIRGPISRRRPERLYIPYMSDCSYAMASALRAYGIDARVMPVADESMLLRGRKYTTGKECLPCAITAGEMLNVISSVPTDGRDLSFFMPSANGPCRFGMYNCMHRLIFKYAGADGCNIIAPNQDDGFYQQLGISLNGSGSAGLIRDLWTALVGVDILQKVILRLRPASKDPAAAQQTYESCLKKWLQSVEARENIRTKVKIMVDIAEHFGDLDIDYPPEKPQIGIVGEIYVRNHPFANMNIIKRLEGLGCVCDLASLAEWIYYTNFTRKQKALRRGNPGSLMANFAIDAAQHRIEKRLARPLEKKFGPLADAPVEQIIKLASPYLHKSFEGEAILSIGKTVEYYHHGKNGVVNVMPFSCMPSTVVSTQTRRLSADCGGMPILNLSFDGQEDATLTTRLEAFVEQAKSHKQHQAVTVLD